MKGVAATTLVQTVWEYLHCNPSWVGLSLFCISTAPHTMGSWSATRCYVNSTKNRGKLGFWWSLGNWLLVWVALTVLRGKGQTVLCMCMHVCICTWVYLWHCCFGGGFELLCVTLSLQLLCPFLLEGNAGKLPSKCSSVLKFLFRVYDILLSPHQIKILHLMLSQCLLGIHMTLSVSEYLHVMSLGWCEWFVALSFLSKLNIPNQVIKYFQPTMYSPL